MERRRRYGALAALIASLLTAALAVGATVVTTATAGSAPERGSGNTVTVAGIIPPGW
ncbi:hypothetical protein AB0D74_03550 [Streptomyces sp. NPDC048278]|uniref:hypothetical protein n=1 Tax=unclassified Streptomyces TaxID=2593676 RepID=UPI0034187CAA